MPRRRWAAGILDTRTTTKRDTINTALREITARYRRPGALEDARQSVADGAWSRVDQDMIAYVRTLRDRARVALLSNIPADHADAFLAAQPWLNDLDHVTFSGRTRPRHLLRTTSTTSPSPDNLDHVAFSGRPRPRRLLRTTSTTSPSPDNLDHVAFSGRIGAAKPDPAAFHHCVTALPAAPADFLFVDDREENVRAAQAVGMNGHVFDSRAALAHVVDAWLPSR
ncbi:FMN phosphatase YigB (HAD superfamily) [Streptomyces sp. SAI-126]|uniref:HAD-IA family hydrolase n=1 Tax=Streptomyces sp. SAI-126 TaxID=3377732 RepID=UPI003C7E08DA